MWEGEGVPSGTVHRGSRSETPPYIHPPVIIEGADENMLVHREEIFGPVLALRKVENPQEALHWANDSQLGLCASIWTGDRRLARQLSGKLEAGVIMINDHLMSHGMPETPWGGYKQSSVGRRHGALGFYEVTQVKVVVDDWLHRLPRNFWWLPYEDHLEIGILGGIDALFSRYLGRRIRGLFRLVHSFAASFKKPR
jgi:succinate-semialdehyde dehydrogenase/glutarate-semialdehyde dehydrogenase